MAATANSGMGPNGTAINHNVFSVWEVPASLSGQHEQSLEQRDFVTDAALDESLAPQQALTWQEALNALSSGNPNGGCQFH